MDFKVWLENEYDKYRDKIEKLSRNFVFQSWFPQERIYLPFTGKLANEDASIKDIEKLLFCLN